MRTTRISVRVEGKTQRELARMAAVRGQSESELIREAIERYLENGRDGETCLDVARRLGIIGSAKNLPRDLSTNKRHMKGFGE